MTCCQQLGILDDWVLLVRITNVSSRTMGFDLENGRVHVAYHIEAPSC